ncbi:hypothetical protein ACFL2T_00905 [Elusimicrobiota bacterium]
MNAKPLALSTAALMICAAVSHAQMTAPRLPSLTEIKAEVAKKVPKRDKLRVWMDIRQDSMRDFTLSDSFLRIRVSGGSHDGKSYRFHGWADKEDFRVRAEPVFFDMDEIEIEGDGVELELKKEWGYQGDWTLRGTVKGKDYENKLDLELKRNEVWEAYFVDGPGVDLKIEYGNRHEINGTIEPKHFGKKSLAALAAAAAMIIRATERPDRPDGMELTKCDAPPPPPRDPEDEAGP